MGRFWGKGEDFKLISDKADAKAEIILIWIVDG